MKKVGSLLLLAFIHAAGWSLPSAFGQDENTALKEAEARALSLAHWWRYKFGVSSALENPNPPPFPMTGIPLGQHAIEEEKIR